MVVRELVTLLGFQVDDKKAKQYTGALSGIMSKVGLLAGAAGIGGLGYKFLTLAGDMEQTKVAFTTMLGSADKATEFISNIQKFAAETPFEFSELTGYAKAMIGVGFASEDVIPALTTLGNIASGVGKEKLPNIVAAFDKMKSKGRASLEELWPMVEAGVPILDQLAIDLGTTKDGAIKMATAGKLSFDQVYKSLQKVEQSKFAGMMIAQSKTFLGVMSNVADIIGQFATSVGTELLPYAKDLATEFLKFFEANKKVIAGGFIAFFKAIATVIGYVVIIVQNLIEDFGMLGEEAGILSMIFDALGTIFKAVGDFMIRHHKLTSWLIVIIGTLIVVQWAWNVAMMANPIGLVIAGIIALIAIGVMLYKNWDKIKAFFIGLWDGPLSGNVIRGIIAIFFPFIGIPLLIIKNWDKIKSFFISLWGSIVNLFKKGVKFIKDLFISLWNGPLSGKIIRGLIVAFAPFMLIPLLIIKYWTPIKTFFSSLWNGLVDGFFFAINKIKAGWAWLSKSIKAVGKFLGIGGGEEEKEGGQFGGGGATAKYATGTAFVPQDGLAYLHKGEKVITAGAVQRSERGGGSSINVNSTITVAVPTGTPDMQASFLKTAAKKAVEESWQSILRQVRVSNPIAQAGRA